MAMDIGAVLNSSFAVGSQKTDNSKKAVKDTQKEKTAAETKKQDAVDENSGVKYEKSEKPVQKASYSINKMSEEERTKLVEQMKADQEQRSLQLVELVKKTITGQVGAYGKAADDSSIWHILAEGKFTVDPDTKAQAQKDIAEDGYWGVKQTSQRLFDFASALAGDDVEQMKKMQAAMKKGFEQATGEWGRDLPDICRDTLDAADKMFADYYASKESDTE